MSRIPNFNEIGSSVKTATFGLWWC